MNKMYYREVHGVVLVCDMCEYESFLDLDMWLKDFIENSDLDERSEVAYIVLGNK